MNKYKVTMFRVINKQPEYYSINIVCDDVATEIWLNPEYKYVLKVEEI